MLNSAMKKLNQRLTALTVTGILGAAGGPLSVPPQQSSDERGASCPVTSGLFVTTTDRAKGTETTDDICAKALLRSAPFTPTDLAMFAHQVYGGRCTRWRRPTLTMKRHCAHLSRRHCRSVSGATGSMWSEDWHLFTPAEWIRVAQILKPDIRS
jgi:hypothetical protein